MDSLNIFGRPPMEMALCEATRVVLQVGRSYVFRPIAGCQSCEKAMQTAIDAYGADGGERFGQPAPSDDKPIRQTLSYYDAHALAYAARTRDLDMSRERTRFMSLLPERPFIMDAGCGSGRDTRAFLEAGARVCAFDASAELAALAADYCRTTIGLSRFDQITDELAYDGVWACASLLHVPRAQLGDAFGRLWRSLKRGGVIYMAFKVGERDEMDGRRHFTDMTRSSMLRLAATMDDVSSTEMWTTESVTPGETRAWLNTLLRKA